jgi:hypothetical protein
MCLIIINKLSILIIDMNETMSLLIATSILALGGLGLYMFQSKDRQRGGGDDDDYDEDNLFSSNSFWSSNSKEDDEDDEPEYHETKVRQRGGKTKRSKRSVGTKRRY